MHSKRKPSLLGGLAISLLTISVGLLGIETFFQYSSATPAYQWNMRLMFFSEGSVFENKPWGGFVYHPNAKIESKTFYITDTNIPQIVQEYSSELQTNSSGFVQLSQVIPSKPSILFLGDSYTEGQGAPPWFYQLERGWPKDSLYQIINGGILGTGFEAWERLYQDTSSTAEINKIVIIFISSDWVRPVWQFPEQELQCLRSAASCTGSDNFFGLPENPSEAKIQINRLAKARIDYLSQSKNFFKDSAIYQRLLHPVYYRWWPYTPQKMEFSKSKTAIMDIVNKLGRENVLFIQLPQKDEINSGPDFLSRKGLDFIHQKGFLFIDGFEECGLDVTDFHTHDGHPNARGYSKITTCVEGALGRAFGRL